MKKLIQNIKTFYLNLHLQTKLLLTYLIIISIPMILIAVFLYGKVYDMIVADTIRNEQQESSKTAPALEAELDKVLANNDTIQNLPFYEQLVDVKKYLNSKGSGKFPPALHLYQPDGIRGQKRYDTGSTDLSGSAGQQGERAEKRHPWHL